MAFPLLACSFALLAVQALADPPPAALATLEELLARQATLEAESATSPALTQVNFAIARKSREALLAKGYQLGEIARDATNPSVFRFPILAGPDETHVGKLIRKASARFKIGYVIEVGGIRYGSYDDPKKLVRLSPKFLLLDPPDMFNTILHETRHAYFWAKGAAGKTSPMNVDVAANRAPGAASKVAVPLTEAKVYTDYFHFQELEAHLRDFHQMKSGMPSNYILDGFSPDDATTTKGETVLSLARAVKKHSEAAIRSLQSGLASSGPLDRNVKLSRSGLVLIVPVSEPGAATPYAWVRILMPNTGPKVPDAEVRKKAIAILQESIKVADKKSASAEKSLAEFRAQPRIGPASCRKLYRRLGS